MDNKRYLVGEDYISGANLINMSRYDGPKLSNAYRTLWDVFIPMMAYRDSRLFHTKVISNRVGWNQARMSWVHLCWPQKAYAQIIRLYVEHGLNPIPVEDFKSVVDHRISQIWHRRVGQIYSTPGALDWSRVTAIRFRKEYLVGYADELITLTNFYCTVNRNAAYKCSHCQTKLTPSEQVRMKLSVLGARLGD